MTNAIIVLLLAVLPSLIVGAPPPAPTFCEGPVNSIIPLHLVSGHVYTIRCQICPRYNYSLDFDILPHQELGDDWSVASSKEDQWREVKLDAHKVNEEQVFTCVAINYDSPDNSSYLYYVMEKIYYGTHFIEGGINTTISKEVTIGTSDEIRCTISDTDPSITSLTISRCHNSNCTVIGDGKSWIGIHFYTIITSSSYTCTATSPVTTSTLTYNLSLYEGISFTQGNANSTYTVNQPLVKGSRGNRIECSIRSDPHLYVLTFEPTNQLRINNSDFIVDKDPSNTYIAVLFQDINDQTPSSFICYARNRLTTATLTFKLSIKPPTPPVFTLGGNDTIIHQAQPGSSYCFKCVIQSRSSLPNITHLSGRPTPGEDDNWKIKDIAEYVEIDICILSANSERNNRLYQCIAFNGVLTTNLTFQNYVGGLPYDIFLNSYTSQNHSNITLSLDITDRNTAPAQSILYYIRGVTKGNVTIPLELPYHSYPTLLKYMKRNLISFPAKSISPNTTCDIYARNQIGVALIKKIPIN